MQLERQELDLSGFSSKIDLENYRRMRRTHVRLLSSRVPKSFLEKFKDEAIALSELLDVVYGTMDQEDSENV